MTDQELEALLVERVKIFDLKKIAFESLENILLENLHNKDFIGGFDQSEIIIAFDGFDYKIDRRYSGSIIRAKIGLYVESLCYLDNKEPIGYYELETNLNGEIVDDWFIIEKKKYSEDIGIIYHFQYMNKKMPTDYLKKNSIQYEYVTYISMIGTLFASKQFEDAGDFVIRAYSFLETIANSKFDKDYLKATEKFLKMIKEYLLTNNLVTENLKQELTKQIQKTTLSKL